MSYVTQDKIPEDICSICVETLKDPLKAVFKLHCGHFFHNNCLNDYCEKTYPDTKCHMCRKPFNHVECNTFWAFKEKVLDTNILPEEVLDIYNKQEGGKKKRKNKSTKNNKLKKQYSTKKIIKTRKHIKKRYINNN